MIRRNITQAKAELSSLIEKACHGEEVVINKAGKPVVKLVAYEGCDQPRKPGVLKGKIIISSDFDELPDDIAQALGLVP